MLAVLTGPARSGKSQQGLALALASGCPVVMAVGALADDAEMVRRIEKHRAGRSEAVTVVEAYGDPRWFERVDEGACLLVDCLGTVLGSQMAGLIGPEDEVADAAAEEQADAVADALIEWIRAREAPTVVVTNEVGWGVVPATPTGRLFRDVLGRANRALADVADVAWLMVAGRAIELSALAKEASWSRQV